MSQTRESSLPRWYRELKRQSIKKAYPGLADTLGNSWQCSVLHGEYQAKGFAKKLMSLLKKTHSELVDVVWDPPHWTNVAIEDVFEAKIGESKEFMKQLIGIISKTFCKGICYLCSIITHLLTGYVGRSSAIHKLFQRQKKLAAAMKKAEEMKKPLHLTSRTCATRFLSSQVHEFRKLLLSIDIYMATYTKQHLEKRILKSRSLKYVVKTSSLTYVVVSTL